MDAAAATAAFFLRDFKAVDFALPAAKSWLLVNFAVSIVPPPGTFVWLSYGDDNAVTDAATAAATAAVAAANDDDDETRSRAWLHDEFSLWFLRCSRDRNQMPLQLGRSH